ncbi:uncharacterized protein EI90DRAFT_3018681 [Cantharellus anzutake]|uniref:uncharacterized protein n=1 Tax=Cantharellus anzutake TaxID=1750568 RepID=UPI00190394A8|nr:uncharacterized protein EI90DRAFT_3018681 [Cantharellus anzutake]KAF8326384.1 hypothetical protein EI90DRAFT_3018681 [Cantharellus anzutake]
MESSPRDTTKKLKVRKRRDIIDKPTNGIDAQSRLDEAAEERALKKCKTSVGSTNIKDVPNKRSTRREIAWRDIPVWKHDRSPFMELPLEILDTITDPQNGLILSDYLALSGVNRGIRRLFTAVVWERLYLYMTSLKQTLIGCGPNFEERFKLAGCTVRTIWSTGWLAIRSGEIITFNCGDSLCKTMVRK